MGLIDTLPGQFNPLDSYGARPTIDLSHHKIHEGLHWTANAYQAGASAVNVLITAPSDIHYHFIAQVALTGPGTVTWIRGANHDATVTTVIVSNNNNEDSENTSTLVIQKGGVYSASGATVLETWLVGSATGNAGQPLNIGGGGSHAQEWELGYSTVHTIRVLPSASCETVIRSYYYRKE